MPTYSGTYRFLTTKPLTRGIFETQDEPLYILPLADAVAAVLDVLITYTDATTQAANVALGGLTLGQRKVIDIGYLSQGYNSHNPAKTIEKIEINIDSEAEKITLIPLAVKSDTMRYFYYFNSQGGMDSFVATGDQIGSMSVERVTAKLELTDGFALTDGEYITDNDIVQFPFQIFSGFKPKLEMEAVKDMILVNNAYEMVEANGGKSPVKMMIEGKSFKFPSEQNNLKQISFKARYAFDEIALDRV